MGLNIRNSEHSDDSNNQEYCASTTFEQMVEADERGIQRLKEVFGKKTSETAETAKH